jgi:diguanylate cyclase (GGDEF)-like protein/PAS domain S-box-containing protein
MIYNFSIFDISLIIILIILLLLNLFYIKISSGLKKYIKVLNKISDNIFIIDIYAKEIVFLNTSIREFLGYEISDIKDIKLEDFLISFDENKQIDIDSLKKEDLLNNNLIIKAYIKAKNLEKLPVEISFNYVKNENRQYIVAICFDLTNKLNLEVQEMASKKIIDEHIPISRTDLAGTITYVNDAFCRLTEYLEEELIGKKHGILRHEDTSTKIYEELWENILEDRTWEGVLKNKTKHNRIIWNEIKISPMYDYKGNKIGYVSTRENINYKKELEYITEHDLLTNIKNRRTYEKELEKHIHLSKRYEKNHFGLIMFDIDHFKEINDNYGHQIGDKILKTLCTNISTHLRENDTFARWGGEEFVILCPYTNIEQLEHIAKNLQKVIKNIDFSPVPNLTISLGLTVYKKDDSEVSIQKRVDSVLYKAKRNGRNQYQISI